MKEFRCRLYPSSGEPASNPRCDKRGVAWFVYAVTSCDFFAELKMLQILKKTISTILLVGIASTGLTASNSIPSGWVSQQVVKKFHQEAEQGNANAQFALALMYLDGINDVEAVKWFQKAAEQGLAEAQFHLASLYILGRGVKQSYPEGVKWLLKAAEQGHVQAQHSLATCYSSGKGVAQSYVEAVKWYEKAAEQGHPQAQYNLGVCYLEGYGVKQNFSEGGKVVSTGR